MDKGMITKLVAVVAVVIIIAAAAAVLLSGGDDDETVIAAGSGSVYGNANGDYRIDGKDLAIMEDIIDGKRSLETYPLADADCDGEVTEKDLEIVKKVIANEDVTLTVIDSKGQKNSIAYPVSDYAVVGGTNVRATMAVLGLADGLKANGSLSNISPVLDKALYDGMQDGSITKLSSKLTVEDINTLTKIGVTAVFSEESGMSTTSEIVDSMKNLGITYVSLNFKNVSDMEDSAKCLGILFNCPDKSEKYADWTNGIIDTIEKNEGSKRGTKTVLSVVMSNSVSGTSSDYYAATEVAGGKNLADWTDSTKKFQSGDNWLLDEKYNADYIFHFKSLTFPSEPSEKDISGYLATFSETYTCKEANGYYLINGVLPLPVRLAVMAEIMYSDCFDDGWSQSLFSEYMTDFLGMDYDLSGVKYIWHVDNS